MVDLGNNTRTTYGYWDVGGLYDNPGGYYEKLWEIKTVKVGGNTLQDVKHTWDAGGDLTIRQNVKDSETENFSYDFLDRLTSATGPYTESYAYNQIGNMTSKGGQSYTYGSSRPHAVTSVGSTNYTYDANGNMTARGTASLTWDAENRLTGIVGSATYVYDGNGFRVKKIEGGATIAYINQYYEKNLTTATVTLYYYLGGKMAAYKQGASITYVHQDHLTGTSLTTNDSGTVVGTIKYFPYGDRRNSSGILPAQQFTGQRFDDVVGLYYFKARYYDPEIGRFISPDSIIPGFANPQSLNRYSYVFNNPVRYTDPSGHFAPLVIAGIVIGIKELVIITAGLAVTAYATNVTANTVSQSGRRGRGSMLRDNDPSEPGWLIQLKADLTSTRDELSPLGPNNGGPGAGWAAKAIILTSVGAVFYERVVEPILEGALHGQSSKDAPPSDKTPQLPVTTGQPVTTTPPQPANPAIPGITTPDPPPEDPPPDDPPPDDPPPDDPPPDDPPPIDDYY